MRTHGKRASLLSRLGCAVVAAAALAACGSDRPAGGGQLDRAALGVTDATFADLKKLYRAALDEGGELVFYGTNHEVLAPVYEKFEKNFPGIKIETHQQTGAQQMASLQADRASGNHVADILQSPNALRYVNAGFAQPYEPPTFRDVKGIDGKVRDGLHDRQFRYSTPLFALFGIGVNTELINPAEVPRNWQDFADGKWAGKVLLHDPTVPGGGQGILTRLLLSNTVDEAWLAGIAHNSTLKGDYATAVQSLVRGEYPILLAAAGADLERSAGQGAPVKFLLMDKDNIGLADKWMLLDGAPHPQTAKLFLNYLYIDLGQQAIADIGNLPISGNARSPHNWPTFTDAKLADLPPEAEITAQNDRVVAILTRIFRRGS
ncbi:MAG: extracellular solute-binding protein [Pseudonocardiaceae bacterium]|nr:extracellular solute-binding protein [Pseudonocardiaceae bacterium]